MATLPPLSIAQSLPSYIIREILQYFSAPLNLRRFGTQYPWYLSHVCSSWRIEFLTMRRHFWNEIIVQVRDSDTEETHQRIIDVLTMFFECNRGHPFSFELDLRRSDRASKSPHFVTIFGLFISQSFRWQRVKLSISKVDIPQLYHVKGRLGHLESLHLYRLEENYTIPESFTDLFMTAPRCTRLSFPGLPTWNFNWSVMTYLDLGYTGHALAWPPSFLSQTVRLETLIIHFFDCKALSNPITPIVLPSLVSLVTDTLLLMQAITAPSLKELCVYCEVFEITNGHDFVGGILKSFFGRSPCHLKALKLLDCQAAVVIGILSHIPDIRILCLVGVRGSVVDVFEWLSGMHPAETPKLTSLQSLAVHMYTPPQLDQIDAILHFVAQRKTRVGSVVEKLQKLNTKWPKYWYTQEPYEGLEEQLRRTCKLYDIQYADKEYIGRGWNDTISYQNE